MEWLFTAGVGLVGVVLWLWEKNSHGDTSKTLLISKLENDKLKLEVAMQTDKIYRMEKVNTLLRGDVLELHQILEASAVPGAFRTRINELLSAKGRKTGS